MRKSQKAGNDLACENSEIAEPMNMALVVVQTALDSSLHHNVGNLKVEEEGDEKAKKRKKEQDMDVNLSAAAGFQPRREP